jgi:frataxin-like iron-binding protein CyaY
MTQSELIEKYKKYIEEDKKRIGELEVQKMFVEKELELLKLEVDDLSKILINEQYKIRNKKCL